MNKLGVAVLVIGGMAVLGAFVGEEKDRCDDTIGAFVMSQSFVKDALKAPSTATFPYSSSDGVTITKADNCSFVVKAYVDAQNSFGAKLRTNYAIKMRRGDGDTWYGSNLMMY